MADTDIVITMDEILALELQAANLKIARLEKELRLAELQHKWGAKAAREECERWHHEG